MRTCILGFFLLLSAVAAAQSSSGYFFGAPGAVACCGGASATLHVGVGADAILGKGFGLALEGGILGPARALGESVFTLSPGISYHFGRERTRVDPFLAGGYTLAFREGAANLGYFGGGLNYWFSRRLGLRFEFRDMLYREFRTYHFVGFRAALAIR